MKKILIPFLIAFVLMQAIVIFVLLATRQDVIVDSTGINITDSCDECPATPDDGNLYMCPGHEEPYELRYYHPLDERAYQCPICYEGANGNLCPGHTADTSTKTIGDYIDFEFNPAEYGDIKVVFDE